MKTLALLTAALLQVSSLAETPSHSYTFTEGLGDAVGGLPITANGGFVAGGRYQFGPGEGLSLAGAVSDPTAYTIEMVYRFDSLPSIYSKLIDFSNLVPDDGLYVVSFSDQPVLTYYNSPGAGADLAPAGVDQSVVVTRSPDGQTSVYLNGTLQFEETIPDSELTDNVLHFFIDDAATLQSEVAPGSVDFIRIYDQALSAADVAALHGTDSDTVVRDLFEVGDGLVTYDPLTNREWLDLTETIDLSINDIVNGEGGWADLGFVPANESDVREMWTSFGIPDIGIETAANTPGIQSSLDSLGCTWNCGGSIFERSTGIVFAAGSQTQVKLSNLDLYYSETPVTGLAWFPALVSPDFSVFSAGVYVYREAPELDSDFDGVVDIEDNCSEASNPDQRDTNGDGFGNACDPDINNDGIVNFADIAQWSASFNTVNNGDEDFNGDGLANFSDYALFGIYFLQQPGPSGIAEENSP